MFGLGRIGAGGKTSGSSGPVLIPIAIGDFKNAAYSIGGVSKTYAEMWTAPTLYGTLTCSVVPGEGLVAEYAGTSTSATGQIFGQPELYTAVCDETIGHSGVLSVIIEGDAAAPVLGTFWLNNSAPFQGSYVEGIGGTGVIGSSRLPPAARVNSPPALPFYTNGALNKIAYAITPTRIAVSVNGSAVVSAVMQPALVDFTAFSQSLYVGAAPTGATMTSQRIAFYTPLSDANLQALSAP